jgi:hypothetical protein
MPFTRMNRPKKMILITRCPLLSEFPLQGLIRGEKGFFLCGNRRSYPRMHFFKKPIPEASIRGINSAG